LHNKTIKMKKEKTNNSPGVYLSIEENVFEISGNAFSDSINDVFSEILEWIEINIPKLQNELVCVLSLNVFNSVTYKNVLFIFHKFEIFNKNGKKISVAWYCNPEDDDMYDLAVDMKELYNIPFEIIIKTPNQT
jgi:hypothetical protein